MMAATVEAALLQMSAPALEAVLDQLPIGAIVLDDDAIVQRFNRYEEQLSGRRREEVIGRTFFSEIAPCTRDIELGTRFREGIARGDLNIDVEFAFPYPYNRVAREVRLRAATVKLAPRPLHVLLIEDITARKSMERDNHVMMTSLQTMLQRFDAQTWNSERSAPPVHRTPELQEGCSLYADLSSFTRMASRIAPAELFATLDRRVRVAVDAILRFGGRVERIMGDGVFAFFPNKGEGFGAIYAALRAARDIVAHRDGEESRQLPFRVGLEWGEVIQGPVGRPEFGMSAVVGEAVVVAQRLANAARPGEILLTDQITSRVQHGVEADELLGVAIPGLPPGRGAFQLTRLDLP